MDILEVDPHSSSQIKEFLALPFRIYQQIPQWVPPLARDARLELDPKRYPFYQHSEAGLFLAWEQNSPHPVGRLAVLNPRLHNQVTGQQTAFFYLFECKNNPEAAEGLFTRAFRWARNRGLQRIWGPKGFTALDGLGLLVSGFEHRPALGIPYNPPYYAELIEAAGFEMESENVSGYLDYKMNFSEDIHRASALIQKRRGLRIQSFRSHQEMRAFLPQIKKLYNGSLGENEAAPLTDAEVKAMADQILWFADPHIVKVVTKNDEPVGFLLAYPDISAAFQRCQGSLWPRGWMDMLVELRKTQWININGAGILKEYRGFGGTAILFSEMYKSVVDSHYRYADLVQIGLENDKMQRELRDMGIIFYKKHRIYTRSL